MPNFNDDEKSAENLVKKIKDKKQQNSELVKKGIEASKQAEKDSKNIPEGTDFNDIPLPAAETTKTSTAQSNPPPPPPSQQQEIGPYGMPVPQYGMHYGPHDRMSGPMHPGMRYPPPHDMRYGHPRMGPMGPYGPRRPPHHDMRYGPPRMGPMHDGYHGPRYPHMRPPPGYGHPPLPPPKSSTPPPPEPPKEEEKPVEEIAPNPSIVIPPEQAEQYKRLQEQAQKHANKQMRRQKKLEAGEPFSESSESEEEEPKKEEEEIENVEDALSDDLQQSMVAIPSPSLSIAQPTILIAQPQMAGVGGLSFSPQLIQAGQPQQFLLPQGVTLGQNAFGQTIAISQASGLSLSQAGHPLFSGAPVFAHPSPTTSISALAAAAAAGAQPAHLPTGLSHQMSLGVGGGLPLGLGQPTLIQHPLFAQQQLAAQLQAATPQFYSGGLQHTGGPVIVGNRLLLPSIVRQ